MSECPPQGPEVRAWVATEIMGWRKEKSEFGVLWSNSGLMAEEGWNSCEFPEFRPDEDRNHTALMEDRLEEMGLAKKYAGVLGDVVAESMQANGLLEPFHWYFAHASAYDRVRAAWQVINAQANT